jgi:hypothetical protein
MSGPDFPPSVDPSAGGYPAPPSGDPPPPETGDPPPGLYALPAPHGERYADAVPYAGNVPAFASLVLGAGGVLLCFFVIVFRPDSGVVFPVGAVLGVLAVVFGGVGLSRSKTRGGAGRDMAMGGCMLEMLTVVVLPVAFYVDALANWSGGGL